MKQSHINQIRRNTEAIRNIDGRGRPVFRRISKPVQGLSTGGEHMALVIQDAPSSYIISCYIVGPDGVTIKTAVDVYCLISGGSNLNEASPRLQTGDLIKVSKLVWNETISYPTTGSGSAINASPTARWFSFGYQATEDCVCEAPA